MHALTCSVLRAHLLGAMCASGLVMVTVTPGHAQAQSTTTRVETGAVATVNRNVYAAGGEVRPGAVQGDLTALGGHVIVEQPVGADASLAAGSVNVRAAVGGDVRAVAGDISIESPVGGELFASGGKITLTPAAVVAGTTRLYGGSVSIEGRVEGELRASAQKIFINGDVRGNANLSAANVELGPKARIGGALNYVSASDLKSAEGATVAGAVTRDEGPRASSSTPRERGGGPWTASATGWVGGLFSYLALLAYSAVFFLVLPKFSEMASERVKHTPWRALGIGFVTLFAVPVFAILLFITLLGIPLGIAVMMLYPVLLLTGFSVGVLCLARQIPAAMRKPAPATFGRAMAYFALALLILLLLGLIPFVGGLVLAFVSLAGIGACVLEMIGRRKGPGASGMHRGPQPDMPVAVPDAVRRS